MKIGDQVTVKYGGQILESKVTHQDAEKSCGYVRVAPTFECVGNILGFKTSWLNNWWIIGLNNGQILEVPA